MTALLLGSISTLADTSELQRQAFNAAFTEHDLDWHWEREPYQQMLATAGGRDRIAAHAEAVGADIDADAIHATKSKLFQDHMARDGVELRAGVAESVQAARDAGSKVALVTSTSSANVQALLASLGPDVSRDSFDVIVTRDEVSDRKPDPAPYRYALDQLGISAQEAVAVEDNEDGVRSAVAAGIRCIAFPNRNTKDHDFSDASAVTDELDPSMLQ